ncbi:sulfate adenylyltransferase subunit CysN [Agaribacterium sp. ZY112]|uniref:sulfate adenylyltransferase subunit CysN n=1 Tax=Agaribacterium sp. ZY112 TaxID=3233574 RepID=UPI003523E684
MSHQSDLIAEDIQQYLKQHEEKDLLRFITCGSVDDGKSTLIGRLLHDTKMIYEDQLAAISKDSKAHGTTGEKVDLALLVDGLQSEREQGITIDVAYRYFSTDKRKFIIADTPGHEQYTRNMATGGSTAQLAILLIDARYGVQTQTRRHSFICSLLGIKNFVIAVNKMDLIDFAEDKYEAIKADYIEFAKSLPSQPEFKFIPISALDGDNVAELSDESPWYKEQPLLDILETVELGAEASFEAPRFPVQYVNRPNLNFRGFCGTVASGVFKPGQEVMALPSHKKSTVKQVVTYEGDIDAAYPGDAVTLTLNDEIDISRGDMIVAANDTVKPVNAMMIDVVWMHEDALTVGKNYYVKVGSAEVNGTVTSIEYQVDVNTLEKSQVENVPLNGIARCKLELTEAVTVDAYQDNRHTGNLIFIDRLSNVTVGAAMVAEPLTDEDVAWHNMDVNKEARASRNGQKPAVIWFTGLSGSGKSTSASALEKALFSMGFNTYLLDGDNVRQGLSKDLGFDEAGRVENIRRVGEVAKLMVDAGMLVFTSFISPFKDDRRIVRNMLEDGEFIEVHVNTALETCEQRDPKGLYKKARSGVITNFTGIDSPYEEPENAEITIDTDAMSVDEVVAHLLRKLRELNVIS